MHHPKLNSKVIFGLVLLTGLLLFCSIGNGFAQQKKDLTMKWDTIRPLANPDKGWYHHLLDNGIHKYKLKNDADLLSFPGMDHLYLRLAWAFLEPEEGKYDWSYIDDVVEKYVPMGFNISFRISCKETGIVGEAVPVEIDGIRYATPYWVVKALSALNSEVLRGLPIGTTLFFSKSSTISTRLLPKNTMAYPGCVTLIWAVLATGAKVIHGVQPVFRRLSAR
jgi:hypothetical protein